MKRLIVLPLLALLFGCAQNHFNVPAEHLSTTVKTLGIAPIIIDMSSDIRHPEKEQLIPLIAALNRKYESQLVRKIKETGSFYTVAFLDGDAQQIFNTLYFRSEKRDDATIRYNKYFWKTDELKDFLKKNNLDAVMLLVVSGLTESERVYSNTMLSSRTGDYNYLILTAQILDNSGAVLWEYPNFRESVLSYVPMINLQYPDFNEAEANLSGKANLKFKTIDGIRRTMDVKRRDMLLRDTQESEVYGKQFDYILSFLKFNSNDEKKNSVPVTKPVLPPEQPARPVVITPPPAAPAIPAAPAPPAAPVASPAPAATVIQPAPVDNEIVPARGSTL